MTVPVELYDERYSTLTADELLAEGGRKRRAPIDAAAAAVILQDYLANIKCQIASSLLCSWAARRNNGQTTIKMTYANSSWYCRSISFLLLQL